MVTSRLLHVEAAAALAQASRMGRISQRQYRAAVAALRGCDAVHCALVDEGGRGVASGDHRFLVACTELGMATADINEP